MSTQFSPSPDQLSALKLASDFAFELYQNDPACQAFIGDLGLSAVMSAEAAAALCDPLYSIDEFDDLSRALRQTRACVMLRLIWQDALGILTLEELTGALSSFACAAVRLSSHFATQQIVSRYELPAGSLKLYTAAMGKMGGGELNLSSDIDLVYLYPKDGELIGASGKAHEIKLLMIKAARIAVQLLDQRTRDGFVFRVDLRLRPWGDGSDIAVSLSALDKYLSEHGRQWERFAWLKARLLSCGLSSGIGAKEPEVDSNLAEAFGEFSKAFEQIRTRFVYRYYVDYTAFAALREMKNLILKQVVQRGDASNVKLGAGGIRDIEFVVQAHQLIYGGRDPELQVHGTLEALKQITEAGYVEAEQASLLEQAYRFLRRLEHALQAINDEQTQTLPADEQQLARIAAVMGFADLAAFDAQLVDYKSRVQREFNQLVGERTGGGVRRGASEAARDANFDQQESPVICSAEVLAEATQILDEFMNSKIVLRLAKESAVRLNDLWPLIQNAVARSNAPTLAARKITEFVEAVMGRSIYLVLLKENPEAVRHLVRMLVASPLVAQELSSYPVLLDSFLLNRFSPLPNRDELKQKLDQLLLRVEPDDDEGLLSTLRLFKKGELLQIAASDILSKKPLMRVSDALTWVAEVVLEAALNRVYSAMVREHGFPMLMDGTYASESASGFGIVGYGKLGGIELSYGSDLDLVFAHAYSDVGLSSGALSASGKNRELSGSRFSARLAQKLMNLLATQTRDGRCYEVDTRLRPSGHAGVLVTSLSALTNYQLTKAWVWEHQALVRARPICGDPEVLGQFDELRARVLSTPRDTQVIRSEVASMRQKMRDHLGYEPSGALLQAQSLEDSKQDQSVDNIEHGEAASGSLASSKDQVTPEPHMPVAQSKEQEASHQNFSRVLSQSKARRVNSSIKTDLFHLKQDRGAIVDIEFIAQFAVLSFSSEHPELIRYTDNIRIFQTLSALGIEALGLTQSQIEDLSADYLSLRFEIHYRALGMSDLLATSSDWRLLRLRVAAAWRAAISDSLAKN